MFVCFFDFFLKDKIIKENNFLFYNNVKNDKLF